MKTKTNHTPTVQAPHLACGHDVDRLIEVRIFPGRRRLFRCSVCSMKGKP